MFDAYKLQLFFMAFGMGLVLLRFSLTVLKSRLYLMHTALLAVAILNLWNAGSSLDDYITILLKG